MLLIHETNKEGKGLNRVLLQSVPALGPLYASSSMHKGTSSQILYILISASMGKLEVPLRLRTVSFNDPLRVWNMFVVIFLNDSLIGE